MSASPAAVATALLSALEPDKFYSPDNAARRFRLAGLEAAQHDVLSRARAAGWVVDYPDRNELVIPAFCWLPTRQAAAAAVETGPLFSYFRGPISNATPYKSIGLAEMHHAITGPYLAKKTADLRQMEAGSPARKALKNSLDYVTPAGVFTRRHAAALVKPSGLLVLDFDHVPDVAAARAALLADDKVGASVVLLFTSPSGAGLKCLMKVSTENDYTDVLRKVAGHLYARYAGLGLIQDKSGVDISRACFLCHDPNAYLNPAFAA